MTEQTGFDFGREGPLCSFIQPAGTWLVAEFTAEEHAARLTAAEACAAAMVAAYTKNVTVYTVNDGTITASLKNECVASVKAMPTGGHASPAADRLSALEDEVEALKAQLQALEARLAELEG